MDCSICSASFASRGQPTCPSCARALVYQARVDHLTSLLERESLHHNVGVIVESTKLADAVALPTGPDLVDIAEGTTKQKHMRVLAETQSTNTHYRALERQTALLREYIDKVGAEKSARTASHEVRRSQLAKDKQQLEARNAQLLEPLQASIKHARRRLDRVHSRTREGRVKLCHETARLAALRARKRKNSQGHVVEEYMIGGVLIPDLRNLNTARPDQVTAALASICRLLTTTCHYLSLRLPAEITPAHANYPHPTIFSLQSSYRGFDLPFPGTPAHHSITSPSNSRLLEHRSLPKLRLLHLDKPLIRLAKEDTVSYNLFLEGVALLAWDVAWLCRSQGLPIANSWEQACDLGKNLCQLFRIHASTNHVQAQLETNTQLFPPPKFGQLSHAAAYNNLETSVGVAWMRNWKITSPHRVIDGLRTHLLTDMSGAEWELIAESEYDAEREDEQAVLVGGARPADDDSHEVKDKRSSGWTKVKSRA